MTQRQGSAYRQVFQHRSFRLFWFGFTFSVMGDMMTRVALTWFVYESTGSATALGWLNLFYTGPVILGGLVAGWLLDRFDRRKVMLADSLLRGAVVALIPLLHALDQLHLWHIYLVAAVYGSLMMVSLAGGPALVPDLVAKRDLATANALETLSFTLGGVLAPPIAGFLIAHIGAPNVIIIDALSYAVFAWALANVALPRAAPEPSSPGQGLSPGGGQPGYRLRDAVQLLLQNKVLLSTTLMFMTFNIGMGFMFVWLPVLAGQMPGGGSALYGTLLGFLAAGEVISSVLAGGLSPSLPLGALICLAQFLSGASLGLFFLGRSAWLAILSLVLFGAFSAPLTIWAQTLRMQIIPEALRGRTFALLRTLMQGTMPVGGVLAGLLLPLLGIPAMITFSALLVGFPGLLGYRTKALRGENRLEHPAGDLV